MVKRDGDSESDRIAASEATVVYHTVHHSQSFCTNDCLSTLIKKIYEPKFSSACSYFLSKKKCPVILQKLFEDPCLNCVCHLQEIKCLHSKNILA
jgi:hypothetical protein